VAAPRVVVIEGDEELARLLEKYAKRAEDLRPVFRGKIDRAVSSFFTRQFQPAGLFGNSVGWAPLAKATRRARLKTGGNKGGLERPLWDSGGLRASFVNPNAPLAIRQIKALSYERGSADFKAGLHQEGFKVKRWGRNVVSPPKNVPAREIVPDPMPSFALRSYNRMIGDYLVTGKA